MGRGWGFWLRPFAKVMWGQREERTRRILALLTP